MATDWPTTTLGALLAQEGGTVKTGPFGTTLKAHEYSAVGVPLISVGEVGDGSLRVSEKTPRVPVEVTSRLLEYLLEPGDIVFGRKGAVDRSAFVKDSERGWFLGSDGIRLRLPDSVDARFFAYQLQSGMTKSWLRQNATGSTMPSLSQGVIERVPVVVPPLLDQRRIAHILGTLDDKIELNRRMNETLEAMARALFKSWFVDFDPVCAKAEGRDPGLPPHLADLFPDRLVDSALGEIPEGWEVRPLGDLLELLETGGRPKGGVARYASGVPSIGAESIAGLGIHDFSKTKYVPREYFDAMKRGHVQDGDVLLYKDGGKPGQFEPHVTLVGSGFPFAECAINEHVYRARVDSALGQIYLYYWLSSEIAGAEMRNRGTGVAIPGLNSTQVKSLPTLVPTQPVAAHFGHACGPLVSRIFANCNQSRALTATRDALLPRLISGEISSSAVGRREAASTPSGP